MGFVGFPGQAGRYVSGLCVATLGLCAAGWLALAPVAFGYRWVVAWRRRLRADGILARGLTAAGPAGNPRAAATRARRRGRGPHPRSGAGAERTAGAAHPAAARVSRAARAGEPAKLAERAGPDENHRPGAPAVPHPRSGGLTAMESMLAGAELLMVGCGEEEAW